MNFKLEIIYQDEYLVAINKPAGLLVHRSLIDRHETRFAIQLTRDQIGQKVYPVHRLDKPTSGVLLFALDSNTARLVSEQFIGGQIHKTYTAIARGYVAESGIINHPLKEKPDKIADARADQDKPAQAAITHYQCLQTYELPYVVDRHPSSRYSLVILEPKMGRRHQLRRHMKHISHHLIGDTTHGNGKHNRFFREKYSSNRLLLHASSLSLKHPHNKTPLILKANLPDNFAKIIRSLKPYETIRGVDYQEFSYTDTSLK